MSQPVELPRWIDIGVLPLLNLALALLVAGLVVAGIGLDPVQVIAQLVKGQEQVVRTARAVWPIVERANDEPTADLLTQRMQVHEKTAWMLRSMLEQ